ncbi:MAG TPA: 16S rRNA (guanine(966)-N(2))-methyltransferase RsmD [Elusimicrobia bacterium]|nr:MAG: 16S rRNA (guanine(966)-N(2))-methyltransferase RsmD [Elusimicrobia bacterium GWA2_66_18]OGR69810.1 MAG: 16S rRNA (guanine(966)-N(2))-methyltransferase RsmD [Elusimicrobia bacterium GWC2_65_9]HAZ08316.1 16S rRNA (guanine(966)-N(2))-methyltransferase RsmD [Elusimicrobiota bacterium]
MRILAGDSRGRRFKSVPRTFPVKPISSRIKKSVFDILRPWLAEARFLDLYAGTGAVGLEALSRGAASCFFVDRDRRCLAVIDENLKALDLAAKGRTSYGDVLQDLSWLAYRAGVATFDLIYLGPPYRDAQDRPLHDSTPSLARVAQAGLLAPGGLILIQHHVKEEVALPAGYERFRREKYGDTFVDFHRRRPAAA